MQYYQPIGTQLDSRPALSLDNLPKSVYQTGHCRTKRFTPISTFNILEGLTNQGWEITKACEDRARKNKGFQRHQVNLRRADQGAVAVGDVIPEIVLTNAANGLACFTARVGMFRVACSNGLLLADSAIQSVKFKHVGLNVDEVAQVTFNMVSAFDQVQDSIDVWKGIEMSSATQARFAEDAMALRWNESPVSTETVLTPNRAEDVGDDLWNVFNRVQENLSSRSLRDDVTRKLKKRSVRPLTAIKANTDFNVKLYELASDYAIANN